MSQTMIKRVAKAIEKLDKIRGEYAGLAYDDIARVAMMAMLDPTNDMLGEAAKAMSPGKRPTPDFVSVKEKHRIRYQAMIRKALEE